MSYVPHVLYGWTTPTTIADAGQLVSDAANVEFQLHDSSYYGGDYLLATLSDAELRIVENFIDDDDEAFVPGPPRGQMLLLIDGDIPAASMAALAELPELRRLR